MQEYPFLLLAGVVLPDHLHFLWELPHGDSDFSKRVGRLKALFTKSISTQIGPETRSGARQRLPRAAHANRVSDTHKGDIYNCISLPVRMVFASRNKHREAGVWQRRFWEHTIRDERDLQRHMDYIHYNPVKHGLTGCPHAWPHSSFQRWVEAGAYDPLWCCCCDGRPPRRLDLNDIERCAGE